MKLLRLLMVFILSMSLVGCQPSENNESDTNKVTTSQNSDSNSSEDNDDSKEDSEDESNSEEEDSESQNESQLTSISDYPKYAFKEYAEINNNVPNFSKKDMTTKSFETYSKLDSLGRCQVAYANIGRDLMPTKDRESISEVKPTGWVQAKYDSVDGKYLYNRCHLIGHQLTAEDANERNLITGTRYFNVEGMLPFENMVADYIRETNNHVLYRVTPVYDGNDLVATGVQMEALSVEDNGEGIEFNVFVYNVQPGVKIDYATGKSYMSGSNSNNNSNSSSNNSSSNNSNNGYSSNSGSSSNNSSSNNSSSNNSSSSQVIRGNSRSKIYHCPGQADYEEMSDSKNLVEFSSEKEAINAGYRKAKR